MDLKPRLRCRRSIIGTYCAEKRQNAFPLVPLLYLRSNFFGGKADRRVTGTSDRFGTCQIVSCLYADSYETAGAESFLFIEGSAPMLFQLFDYQMIGK